VFLLRYFLAVISKSGTRTLTVIDVAEGNWTAAVRFSQGKLGWGEIAFLADDHEGASGALPVFGVIVAQRFLRCRTSGCSPYDVVFLLNHYFAEMAAVVEATGGHYSNFTGDGLMALFGLEQNDDHGAGAALRCALRMLERLENLNQELASELAEPLQIGVGIHTGDAIVGQMGPPKTPVLIALGDAVNTAARVKNATKELKEPAVISRDTLEAAGHLSSELSSHDVLLRARSAALAVAALNAQSLTHLLATLSAR
jgi:class 3 adenylate cyclase